MSQKKSPNPMLIKPASLHVLYVYGLAAASFVLCGNVSSEELPKPASDNAMSTIDRPAGIPFYVGNMSVDLVVGHPITDPNNIPANDATLKRMRDAGVFAAVDYLAWRHAEKEPEQWDFSDYREKAAFMRANGMEYVPFSWVHFPPKWYLESEEFVPYKNLVTGETIPQLSLWAPDLERLFDRFYGALAAQMGDKISFIRLAMPSEYGEIGYCAGYTNWLVPQPHAGPGFWCGDRFARADFRRDALERYGSLAAVNAGWGTSFEAESDICPPDPARWAELIQSAAGRVRWLDFLDWYNGSMERGLETLVRVVRRHFPETKIVFSLGYAAERPSYGNDQGRYLKAAARLGIVAQSPTNVGHFAPRRVASASRFYGVPYFTEPPGVMNADQVLDRIFIEISNGTDVWFDYLGNLEAGREALDEYRKLLDGRKPDLDIAIWHPTTDLELDPSNRNWSQPTEEVAEFLRDAIDYHVVDDRMIRDGALEKLGIRCLILAGAQWGDGKAWQKVRTWVEAGGSFILGQGGPVTAAHGTADLRALLEADHTAAEAPSDMSTFAAFAETAARPLGKGSVLTFDSHSLTPLQKANVLASLAAAPDSARIDGVCQSRFGDAVGLYNSSREKRTVTLGDGVTIDLPARSIRKVDLSTGSK